MGPAALIPAKACLADVRAFNGQIQKDGYWVGASDYGYGYGMGGYGYGYGDGYPIGDYRGATGYGTTRPAYEIRNLIASANILAQNGQQQTCEDVLATTRTIYASYVAGMHERGIAMDGNQNWRQQEVATAQPVTGRNVAFRSDQLLDTSVLTPGAESLGSVHDIIMSPTTGKIAYLVIARGGLFGIDQSYVPVPWDQFKATRNGNLLVLASTTAALKAAPQVGDDAFAAKGGFDKESLLVDGYWKAQVPTKLAD
jgi:sporulation protein YlmC with PRC-barrel domain